MTTDEKKSTRTRTTQTMVYLSPDEKRDVQAAAGLEGQTDSAFMRTVAVGRARKILLKDARERVAKNG